MPGLFEKRQKAHTCERHLLNQRITDLLGSVQHRSLRDWVPTSQQGNTASSCSGSQPRKSGVHVYRNSPIAAGGALPSTKAECESLGNVLIQSLTRPFSLQMSYLHRKLIAGGALGSKVQPLADFMDAFERPNVLFLVDSHADGETGCLLHAGSTVTGKGLQAAPLDEVSVMSL